MWQQPEHDQFVQEIFLAGERVESGEYVQIGTGRVIRLPDAGHLPASLDGRVACYIRSNNAWKDRPDCGAPRGPIAA